MELQELTYDECCRLLTQHHVGRLGVVVGGQPVILPVNYVFAHDRVLFRTDEGLKLRHAPRRRVAFEIDGIDDSSSVAWSVLVKGTAYEITRAADALSDELRRLPVTPLDPGEKAHWIEIVPLEITGRRLERVTPG